MSVRTGIGMLVASATSMVLLTAGMAPAGAADRRKVPYIPDAPLVKAVPFKVKGKGGAKPWVPNGKKDPLAKGARKIPGAAADVVDVPGSGLSAAETVPVEIGARKGADLDQARVEVHSHTQARRAGINGLLLSVRATDGGGDASVRVDYSDFAELYGASWSSRLQLVQYPACVLTTPTDPECRRGEPLRTQNDGEAETLSAVVDLPMSPKAPEADASEPSTPASPSPSGSISDTPPSPGPEKSNSPEPTATATATPGEQPSESSSPDSGKDSGRDAEPGSGGAAGAVVAPASFKARSASLSSVATVANASMVGSGATVALAAQAGPSGSSGDFGATSLASSGAWSHGGATGGFTWSYDIDAPAPGTGVGPSLSLGYSTNAVDGQNTTSNNQSSWVGTGWGLDTGFVERTYRTCADISSLPDSKKTGDQCWAGDIVNLSLPGGSSGALVKDDTSGEWRVEGDEGMKVELKQGADNGVWRGENWVVTSRDGTKFHFGLNRLPGSTAAQATNSALGVPVFSPESGDPCYDSTFRDAKCNENVGYRWMLDYVVDVHGNATVYSYAKERNHYASIGATAPGASSIEKVGYERAAYLESIRYGLSSSALFANSPHRIDFTVAERCMGSICTDSNFDQAHASSWPDVPVDQHCTSSGTCTNFSPSFWSRKRLTEIATKYLDGGTYRKVDSYALAQTFSPNTGDELILDSITRTGSSGGTPVTLEPVRFSMITLANRVEGMANGLPGMYRSRMSVIRTETGQIVTVRYNSETGTPARCTPSTVPSVAATNTTLCYPVKWAAYDPDAPTKDYFHKYVVTQVVVSDQNNITPAQLTTYAYKGGAAWRYDDSELTKPKNRTWNGFRGFGEVETRTGDSQNISVGSNDQRTLARTFYFRGLHGNRKADGTSADVSISDSEGGSAVDRDVFGGQVLETQEFDFEDGSLLRKSITRPTIVAETATRARPGGLSAQKALIVRPAWSASYVRKSDGTYLKSKEDDTYDAQGRSTRTVSTADGAATLCDVRTYADNTSTWVRDQESESISYSGACDTGTVLQRSRTYYDGSTTLGTVTKGAQTRTESFVDATKKIVETATFDSFGRQLTHTVENPGATPATRTTTTTYTPSGVGALQKVETQLPKAGHTTTQTLEPARGQTVKLQEVGGLVTEAVYDGLGRRTSVWHPGQVKGTDPASVTYQYTVSPSGPLAVRTNTWVDPGGGATPGYVSRVDLYDALGKPRQTQVDAPGGGRMVTDAFSDSHGWVRQTNDGWHATGAAGTQLITTTDSGAVRQSFYYVDGLGRETLRFESDSGSLLWRTTVYGGDRTTVLVPQGGTSTTAVHNGRGETTRLLSYRTNPTASGDTVTGGDASVQEFTYDALGRQLTMTTPKGASTDTQATWRYTYDLTGRVIQTVTPSAGTSTTEYYDTGEVKKATDGAGRIVNMSYDALGRPLARTAGATGATPLASWEYDTKKVGFPTASTSVEGGKNYRTEVTSYDAVGRPLGSTVTLDETGFQSSYTSSQTWTKTGLLATSRTADSVSTVSGGSGGVAPETLTYRYDKWGNPLSMTGENVYVQDTTYNAFFEPTRYVYGVNNQTMTSIIERGAFRRVTATTLTGQLAAPQIDKTSYTYDAGGNVTSAINQQGNANAGPIVRQCFKYDNLRQLTEAWSTKNTNCTAPASTATTPPTQAALTATANSNQPYWMRWSYRADGSRTKQEKWTAGSTAVETTNYAHADGTKPHRLTMADSSVNANDVTLTYNADGAVATRKIGTNTQSFSYDADGSLKSIVSAGGTPTGTTTYVQDANGNVLLRKDPTSSTLYLPGQEVKVSSTKAVSVDRYYDFDGTNIGVRTNRGAVKYVVSDLNGTNQVAIDPANSWTVTRRYLDPYGNTLKPSSGSAGVLPGARSFLNQPLNPTTSLVDMGARQYDPLTGQFLAVDPIVDGTSAQQAQGYTYANNNPLTFSDASGLWSIKGAFKSVASAVTKTVSTVVKATYTAVKSVATTVSRAVAPVVDRVQSAARSYSSAVQATYRATTSAATTTWNAATSGATQVVARTKTVIKKVDVVGSALKAVAVEAYNFAIGDMIRTCSQGLSLSCGAEIAMMTPWGKVAKAGKLAFKVAGKMDEAIGASRSMATSCRVNSFTAVTPVLMADGDLKPIKDVALGDMVMAEDPETGEKGAREVVDLIRHGGMHTMVAVELSDGSTIDATDGHPFWVESKDDWVAAIDLWPGDVVVTEDGDRLKVKSLAVTDEDLTAYNLTVDDLHTYYAGDESVLVHNCGVAEPAGIIYRRTSVGGGKDYIGQAKSERRFAKRQKEHARANPDEDFEFEVIGRAQPGVDLNRMEEYYIRQGGGPTNLSNPTGGLANKRHEMNPERYKAAGGDY